MPCFDKCWGWVISSQYTLKNTKCIYLYRQLFKHCSRKRHRNIINPFFSFTSSLFRLLYKVAQEIHCFSSLNTSLSRVPSLQCGSRLERSLSFIGSRNEKSETLSQRCSSSCLLTTLSEDIYEMALLRDSRGKSRRSSMRRQERHMKRKPGRKTARAATGQNRSGRGVGTEQGHNYQ